MGYDADAAAIYNEALKDDEDFKTGIPPAAIFSPGGHKLLKAIPRSIHFEKVKFHDALKAALRENPMYDAPGPEERKVMSDAKDAASFYRAARVRDAAAADDARSLYEKSIAAEPGGGWAARSHLGLAILDRHAGAWDAAEKRLDSAEAGGLENLADDIAMERAHALIAARKDAQALARLDEAIRAHPASNRLGELRFYAGAVNWRLKKQDWANYHWWWVLENLPDDHHVIRCSVALTAPANCFANPELDGFAGKSEMTINEGVAAREAARHDYLALKDKYGK